MKKIIIEITRKEVRETAPIECQENALNKISEMITDGFISGEVMFEPQNKEEDYIPYWWTLKTSN